MKYKAGDILMYKNHECIITDTWVDDGKEGITIKPTGDYGFEVDVYVDQDFERKVKGVV